MKGWYRGVCRRGAEGKESVAAVKRGTEVWHGVGRGKKYKSGVGNWQNFSWDELTGGDGGLEEEMRQLKKSFQIKIDHS